MRRGQRRGRRVRLEAALDKWLRSRTRQRRPLARVVHKRYVDEHVLGESRRRLTRTRRDVDGHSRLRPARNRTSRAASATQQIYKGGR